MARKSGPVKNLKQSINAATKATKKVVKVVSARKHKQAAQDKQLQNLTKRKSFGFRDLPIRQSNSLPNLVTQLETRADELDGLKRPGEYWAFTLFGHKSHQIFESLDLMLAKLRQYKIPNRKDDAREMVESIRFIKFGGHGVDTSEPLDDEEYDELVGEYQAGRERATKARRKKRVKMESDVREKIVKVTGVKARDNFQVLEGVLKAMEKMEEQNRALNKKLAAMQKAMGGKGKKSNATNKTASKKRGAKKPATNGGKTKNGKGSISPSSKLRTASTGKRNQTVSRSKKGAQVNAKPSKKTATKTKASKPMPSQKSKGKAKKGTGKSTSRSNRK